MRRLLLGLLVVANLCPVAATAAEPASTAFVHVNVVPMDRERVLRDQTVIVEGDRIVAIGPHLAVPANARMIDGHGTAYLSPGLADMHTHSETRNDLGVYVAQGVTTVLQMGGARSGFLDSTVPAANKGAIPAPHVYAAFLVDGTPDYNGFLIKTPAEARAIVGLAKTNGYDFIKVYVGLAPDVFDALAEEGHRLGLPLVGHGVTSVRLEHQLAAGQVLVAHAEEFFYTYFTPRGVEETDTPPDIKRIPDAIALARKYHATVTADMATYAAIGHQIQHPDVVAGFLARPESAYLSPNDRLAWQRSDYVNKTAKLDAKLAFLRSMVKAMADANVELVTGTDAPAVPGMLPGFSLHDDLDELEASGLTRFQALSAATRNPGAFIARTKGGEPFGIVAAGDRADLVLSSENPLDNLSTLRTPLGVMAHGQWWDGQGLRQIADGVRDSYRRASAMPPAQ
ncbi:amidohydrolase family protein [Dyella kyungheensis]|uniref:Amidohydrolase n=1 Tax=Dyella kyungheensis TaxID=1242174 RepID=A0ABS2JUX6_9GAMM|nr:amidohydrolase [Dyella kyungheensis]MBM7121868.1 amidohydrolase [Dyella kyungheensis]